MGFSRAAVPPPTRKEEYKQPQVATSGCRCLPAGRDQDRLCSCKTARLQIYDAAYVVDVFLHGCPCCSMFLQHPSIALLVVLTPLKKQELLS